ncbi:MAG: hypothetical protein ACHP9Z_14040 [Streptosporangiales bacterium]
MITNERAALSVFKQQRGGAGQLETACMSAARSSRIKISQPVIVIMEPLASGVIPRN